MSLVHRVTGLGKSLFAGAMIVLTEVRAHGGRRVAQRLGVRALGELARRFPVLSDLVGGWVAPASNGHAAVAAPFATPAPVSKPEQAPVTVPPGDIGRAATEDELGRLSKGDWHERLAAVRAVSGSRDDAAVSALTHTLADPSVEVASAAAEALAASGSQRAKRALVEVLRDPDDYCSPLVRAACALSVGRMQLEAEDEELLLDAVGDADAEVSIAAIGALAEHDIEGAADRLLELLEERSGYYVPATRLAAARALKRLPRADAKRVGELLNWEADPAVRMALGG